VEATTLSGSWLSFPAADRALLVEYESVRYPNWSTTLVRELTSGCGWCHRLPTGRAIPNPPRHSVVAPRAATSPSTKPSPLPRSDRTSENALCHWSIFGQVGSQLGCDASTVRLALVRTEVVYRARTRTGDAGRVPSCPRSASSAVPSGAMSGRRRRRGGAGIAGHPLRGGMAPTWSKRDHNLPVDVATGLQGHGVTDLLDRKGGGDGHGDLAGQDRVGN
jgi:hypothetical protein